jgi:hypothetical protein
MYERYRRTDRMMDNLLRDETTMPIVGQLFRAYHAYVAAARDVLLAGRRLRGKRRTRVQAAIGHALAFPTWSSLARDQGLSDEQAVELMRRLVAAAD